MKKSLKECLDPSLNKFSIKVYGNCGYRNFSPEILLDELRPKGKWSEKQVCYTTPDNDFGFGWECSHCKEIVNKGNYCSNCGAKMEVDE